MAGEKTEKPTPQRLKKAREEGQVLSSRGALTAVQFVLFAAVAGSILPAWSHRTGEAFAKLIPHALAGAEMGPRDWSILLRQIMLDTFPPLLLLGALLFTITLATQFAITRSGFSLSRLAPNFARLSPASRLKELPLQNLKALVEAVLLLAVLGMFLYSFLGSRTNELFRMPMQNIPFAAAEVGDAIENLLWKAAALFVVFGGFDLFVQYRRHISALKMTRQEMREENRRNEGDPQIKNRIRRLRRDMLRRQMMRDIPKATAVIVNPTHFAVAVRYELGTMGSPVVVGKGKNWLALRIRQIATQNEVPIVENPPLARALYAAVEVGSAISPEFYKAIAEILAYVYRLMGRKLP